jgi:hypothetical protein
MRKSQGGSLFCDVYGDFKEYVLSECFTLRFHWKVIRKVKKQMAAGCDTESKSYILYF